MDRRSPRQAFPRSGASRAALLGAAVLLASGCSRECTRIQSAAPDRAAAALWQAGDFKGAHDAYLAVFSGTRNPAYARSAAAAARLGGLHAEALAARRAALAADPSDSWSAMWEARLLMAAGDFPSALSALETRAGAWVELTRGQVLRRLGRDEDALAALASALAADPNIGLAQQERGEILEQLGRNDEAMAAYTSALALDRSAVHLNLRLARLESATGRFADAFERYRKYLLVQPGHQRARSERQSLAERHPELAAGERERAGEKERKWKALTVASARPLPPVPLSSIAVGILEGVAELRMKCSATVTVESGSASFTVPPQAEIRCRGLRGALSVSWEGESREVRSGTRLLPGDAGACFMVFNVHFARGYFWSEQENRSYRGAMEVRCSGKTLTLINLLPIEEYLLSVVPAEMPSAWPQEALKVQAVAARSETLNKLGRHRSAGFDVCASQHCAVYAGAEREHPNTTRAVTATRGEVLEAAGRPVNAVYADNCGGWTSSPDAIWGGRTRGLSAVADLKPSACGAWQDVPDDPDLRERFIFERPPCWCNHPERPASTFRWTRSYLRSEFDELTAGRTRARTSTHVVLRGFTPEGRVTAIYLAGIHEPVEVRKDAIRNALGTIKSNYLTLEELPAGAGAPAQVTIYGAGWGHGAGMCQSGAFGLAKGGIKYGKILAHYYPGSSLKRIY